MLRAIYPGSFDPVTLGHLDIIRRSASIADELIVGILNNKAKTPLFSVGERVRMLEEVTKDFPNVKIIPFEGLLVEFAKQMDAKDDKSGVFLFEFDNGKRSCKLWGRHYTVCAGSDCKKNKREDRRKKRSVNYEQSY